MLITSTFAWALLAIGAYRNAEASAIAGSAWLASWYEFAPSLPGMISETVYGVFTSGQSIYNCNPWTMRPEMIGSLYVFVIGGTIASRRLRALSYIALGAWYWPDDILLFCIGALLNDFRAELKMIVSWTSVKASIAVKGVFFCIATEKWFAALHLPLVDITQMRMLAATFIVISVLTWGPLPDHSRQPAGQVARTNILHSLPHSRPDHLQPE